MVEMERTLLVSTILPSRGTEIVYAAPAAPLKVTLMSVDGAWGVGAARVNARYAARLRMDEDFMFET